MKDFAEILATTITLSEDVHVAFDVRPRTDAAHRCRAHAVRSRFLLRLDEGSPVVLSEVLYAVAFLNQAHEYVRTAYLKTDAEQLLDRLASEDAGD